MLRPFVLALVLGAGAPAFGEEFPESALGVEVRGDRGETMGRVTSVVRDAHGRIVAAEIEGLEPADAPAAPPNLIVEDRRLRIEQPPRLVETSVRRTVAANRTSAR